MPAAKKPTAAAKAPAAKVVTISSKQLAATLAASHDLPKKTVETLLTELTSEVVKQLKKGHKVRLGLGILQVRKRAARMGRNPATGAAIKIKASKKLAFRPAKEIKEAI